MTWPFPARFTRSARPKARPPSTKVSSKAARTANRQTFPRRSRPDRCAKRCAGTVSDHARSQERPNDRHEQQTEDAEGHAPARQARFAAKWAPDVAAQT